MSTYYIGNGLWGDSDPIEHAWSGPSKLAKKVKSGIYGAAKKGKQIIEDKTGITAKNNYKKAVDTRDRVGESYGRAQDQWEKASKEEFKAFANKADKSTEAFFTKNISNTSDKDRREADARLASAERKHKDAKDAREKAWQKVNSVHNTYGKRIIEAEDARARYENSPVGKLDRFKKKISRR